MLKPDQKTFFKQCVACGTMILMLSVEHGPGLYGALCKHCEIHVRHTSPHTHQGQPLSTYVGHSFGHVVMSTSATGTIFPVL